MKHIKKQWIKGLMLSTILGLGVGVAGDVSHAAGNENSQIVETSEWDPYMVYEINDVVRYNGEEYKVVGVDLMDMVCGEKPDIELHWNLVDKPITWKPYVKYPPGTVVIYEDVAYEAVTFACDGPGATHTDPANSWKWIPHTL